MHFNGESYKINKLYQNQNITCEDVNALNISDIAKENFCNYVLKNGFKNAFSLV